MLAANPTPPDPGTEHPVVGLMSHRHYNEAKFVLEHYVEKFPDDLGVHANLGVCYSMTGEPLKAIPCFKRAVEIDPTNVEAQYQLARAYLCTSQHAEAIETFKTVVGLVPGSVEPYGLLAISYRGHRDFDSVYREMERYTQATGKRDSAIDSVIVFTREMDERTTRQESMECRHKWYSDHKLPWKFHSWPNVKDPEKKLTICFIGADFRNHSAAFAFSHVIFDLNREKFKVMVVATNDAGAVDDMTEKFKKSVDVWYHIPEATDEQIAHQIVNEGVDILVDLSGHTPGNRLRVLTAKPAPIVCHMVGFVGSAGIPDIDYTLGDTGYITPEEAELYPEKVYNLPTAHHFYMIDYTPPVSFSPCTENGYITFGCFQHFSKVSDENIRVFGEVLRRVPTARLIIKEDTMFTPKGRERAIKWLGQDVADRVAFEKSTFRHLHLEAHNRVDIMLDTWPQAGGVTTMEAITMGVPVVSFPCERPYGRACVSINRYLPDDVFLTNSVEEYVEKAAELAAKPEWLKAERVKRRERFMQSPLGDTKTWIAAVEDAFRGFWREYCSK